MNQEKALVGAFSENTNLRMVLLQALRPKILAPTWMTLCSPRYCGLAREVADCLYSRTCR